MAKRQNTAWGTPGHRLQSSSSRKFRGVGVEEAQWGLLRSIEILGDQHRYFELLFLGQGARGRIAARLNDT